MNIGPPPGGWSLFLQVAFAFLVTICLCIWQVGRGLEKRALNAEYLTRLQQPPLDARNWHAEDSLYRVVEIRGEFDSQRAFVVENKYHNGALGFWVIGVFNSDYGRFLINRGWIAVETNVFLDPKFETPVGTLRIRGVLWPSESNQVARSMDNSKWPVRTRTMNVVAMARASGAFAQEVRLVKDSLAVLQPTSLNITYSAGKHWSYAFQWIFFGCLVLLGYWYFVIKRQRAGDIKEP